MNKTIIFMSYKSITGSAMFQAQISLCSVALVNHFLCFSMAVTLSPPGCTITALQYLKHSSYVTDMLPMIHYFIYKVVGKQVANPHLFWKTLNILLLALNYKGQWLENHN